MKLTTLMKNGLIAGVVAAVANAALYLFSKSAGIVSDSILLPDGKPLLIAPVIISSVISGVVASLVLLAFSRFTGNPLKYFTVTGLLFLTLSMAGPFTTPGLPTSFRLVLVMMHLVAGLTIIYFLSRKAE